MQDRRALFIGGEWVASTGTATLDVVNATSEEVMGRIPDGTVDDVRAAVAAAAAAFPAWSATPHAERAKCLRRMIEGLQARIVEIATTISGEVGTPFMLSQLVQVGLALADIGTVADVLEAFTWEQRLGSSLVVREPIGVVGCITPWNYPLHQVTAKVAPALAAGCTVVLKPSEIAPLSAFAFAEVLEEADMPPGVFNLVTGAGAVVGEAVASHPDVDMISFTGSTRAGRRVAELAAATVKKTALELGGKSANVILDDADLGRAIPDAVAKCFLNAGQTCSALTRLLVPRSLLDDVEQRCAQVAQGYTPGDPFGDGTRLGPLVSAAQRERVRAYIRAGIEEGATLVTGGSEPPEGLPTGFFVRPTVFSDVTRSMTIAQEEIFGPVMVILPYDSEDEAVDIANDTIYGLAGGVWSTNPERALAVARRLRAGQVEVNGGSFNPIAPFGGYKQSGVGRELGRIGFEEFLETKSLQL